MTMPLFAVYGASGYGREVMPLARAQLLLRGIPAPRLVFVDDRSEARIVNGHAVLRYAEFIHTEATERHVAVAIADSQVREMIAARCASDRVRAWTVAAANVMMMDDVELGEGALLSPFAMLTSNIRVGRHFQANIYSYVAHDCVIGDFVTFAPGVKCNGNVVVGDHAYIGTGAVIRQGRPGAPLRIGRSAVVGMGAVVTRDVPPGVTVVGNPAKLHVREGGA
jgi:sugar O-acyltransferase (sialic acid O-acetyltransferase NeuD family)